MKESLVPDYKDRIEKIETVIFPYMGLKVPRYPKSSFTPMEVHEGAESSARFRFAVMNVLLDASSQHQDGPKLFQEIYDLTSDSLSGLNMRLEKVLPALDCVPNLNFNRQTYQNRRGEIGKNEVSSGNLVLEELIDVFGQSTIEWLRSQSQFGSAPIGFFLASMAAGKQLFDFTLEAELYSLVLALLAEPKDFEQALKSSSANLETALQKAPQTPPTSASVQSGAADKLNRQTEAVRQSENESELDRDERPEPPQDFSKAKLAIEYSPVAATAWARVQSFEDDLQHQFLSGLENGSVEDVSKLLERLEAEHMKRLRPLDTDEANDALEQARTISSDAALEFQRAYEVIKLQVKPSELLKKIEAKFGKSQSTLEREERERQEREERERLEREERERLEREERERLERERRERLERERREELAKLQVRAQQERERRELAELDRVAKLRADQERAERKKRRTDLALLLLIAVFLVTVFFL